MAHIFAIDSMGLYSIQISAVGSKICIFSAIECLPPAIQGHPGSMILVLIESVYETSY